MDINTYNRYIGKVSRYYEQGRYEKALKYTDKLINGGASEAGTWNIKGLCHSFLGQNEEAITSYDRSLNLNPSNHIVWQNKADSLMHLGRFNAAVKCYDKTLEVDPTSSYALNFKGLALNNLGKYKEALKCFDDALEVDPNNEIIVENRNATLNALEHEENGLDSLFGNKICPGCGFENSEGANFCESCGNNLEKEEIKNSTCLECGFENKEGAKFCSGCGIKLKQEKETNFCNNCGSENEETAKFCQECGESLQKQVEKIDLQKFVDVNNDSEEKIASIPGIGPILAKKAIKIRETKGSFESIGDFCLLLELKPHIAKNVESLIICKPVNKPKELDTTGRVVDF